ncbi:MAG TPA: hypothetical protein DHC76_15010 [Rhodobacteraceae bacterium]|nr:hypothetical protein [Paracoccaceae bacterium]
MWLTGGDSYVHVHTSHAKAALGLKGRSKMGDIVMARVGEKLQSREDPAGVQFPVFCLFLRLLPFSTWMIPQTPCQF